MEKNKPFGLGILVGRFQTLHAGHEMMLDTALRLCERTAVFIGSSQESGTEKNPYPFELRKRMLESLYGEALHIHPLPDIGVGNNGRWGEYVLEQVKAAEGCLPDLLVSGKEERRVSWFDGINGCRIAELYIPKTIDISASQLRRALAEDDREAWEKYVSPKLYPLYEELREQYLLAMKNTFTKSI